MHYAGVGCEMDIINSIVKKYKILVIEDAAHGIMAKYKEKYLGTIGDIGTFSFHETKNYSCGEGGSLLIQNEKFIERAEIILEKGTNRKKFFAGEVDKYTWVDIGSSYMPSEINAACLWAQFEIIDKINRDRLKSWNLYYEGLKELAIKNFIELPYIPQYCEHNAHMFYIKLKDFKKRTAFIEYLKKNKIMAIFHYIPLHSSSFGKKVGIFCGKDLYTTKESERLVRLPIFYKIKQEDILKIIDLIKKYFKKMV
jgi:dTDP-4-amino-4,6-dideoxygalactose transaminase